ncbi:DUF4185 domain-containing protein [candidate division KSB1 bacterium]|nr:DUF4185 domain-containing protein [candidate division KSB1 bacterium]
MNKKVILWLIFLLLLYCTSCNFKKIIQPKTARPGEIIEISLTVYDNLVPEPNPHPGVVGILMPDDWKFISGNYEGSLGTGNLDISSNWTDSIETVYPAALMGENMHWIGLITDKGFTYNDPVTVTAKIKLQVGMQEGCFHLGYLVTKATANLISSGNSAWAPFSYPHPIGIPDSSKCRAEFTVQPASDWDALFNRSSGWTGADGIYSIPLSGREIPADSGQERTLFVFGDTFIGEVNPNGERVNSKIVNNTLAFLKGNQPLPEQIQFYWLTNQNNQLQAVFVPETPNAKPGEWYWLMDGIALNEKIHVFALRLKRAGTGDVFDFMVTGVSLISFTLDENFNLIDVTQIETPLFYQHPTGKWSTVLGQAIMPLHKASQNPVQDGFIYIYGPRDKGTQKELVVARVLPENFEDFSQWTYWNGTAWDSEIQNCAPLTNQISQEFSVSPVSDNKFLLVFQAGEHVAVRYGKSPTGPFGIYQTVYFCPEAEMDWQPMLYNAKAHPHLSAPGELLISYNVNSYDFFAHFSTADIYRPHFISLRFNPSDTTNTNIRNRSPLKKYFKLFNCPNPFNPATRIHFTLPEAKNVALQIFNIKGEEIRILLNEWHPEGDYSVIWDGKDDRGTTVGSGVYFYQLQTKEYIENRKMLLIR